jgi:pimeloyl-[acyl-carrier protein] methyl ester esterase
MPNFPSRDTTAIHFEDQGTGPPVVFLHGWSLSSSVWRSQVQALSTRYRCLAPDLRGHGRSAAPDDGYSLENFVSDLAGLLEHLDIRRATVVGWSFGALVALAAFSELRERLSSLVLVSGTAKFSAAPDYPCALSPKEPRVLGLRLKRDREKAYEEFFFGMFPDEERSLIDSERIEGEFLKEIPRPPCHAAARSLETLATADLRDTLHGVDVPVLLVHGTSDRICPVDASRFMAMRLPRSTLKVLDGAGHAPMLTRAAELNALLNDFLERIHEST